MSSFHWDGFKSSVFAGIYSCPTLCVLVSRVLTSFLFFLLHDGSKKHYSWSLFDCRLDTQPSELLTVQELYKYVALADRVFMLASSTEHCVIADYTLNKGQFSCLPLPECYLCTRSSLFLLNARPECCRIRLNYSCLFPLCWL